MEEQEITCELLSRILEMERLHKVRKNKLLTKLDTDFYVRLADYLTKLERMLDEEYKNSTASHKAMLLRDELERAKRLSEAIYSEREEKIVSAAISAVRGGEPDLKNLISEEKSLYEEILISLKKGREKFSTKEASEKQTIISPHLEDYKPERVLSDYIVIRALIDLSFIGSDEIEYCIRKNDVVTLPKDNADLLCKSGKAAMINSAT